MSRISEAISDLHKMDMEAEKNGWLQGLHPLPKLLVTILFILLTVSFGKYDLSGLLKMGVYLHKTITEKDEAGTGVCLSDRDMESIF